MGTHFANKDLPTTPNSEEAMIQCETTAGAFTMNLVRGWSPHGYDRAVELFERHFYDGSHFFRVVPGFLVQFGISYSEDHELQHFAKTSIPDDPQLDPPIPFHAGTISYAGGGDNSRTSQIFISYGTHASLGQQKWETPLGTIVQGMEVVNKLYSYGDMPPWGNGPVQQNVHGGPQYIEENFPKCDKFIACSVHRYDPTKDQQQAQPQDGQQQKQQPQATNEELTQNASDKVSGSIRTRELSNAKLEKLTKQFSGFDSVLEEYGAIVYVSVGLIVVFFFLGVLGLASKNARARKASKAS